MVDFLDLAFVARSRPYSLECVSPIASTVAESGICDQRPSYQEVGQVGRRYSGPIHTSVIATSPPPSTSPTWARFLGSGPTIELLFTSISQIL